MQNDITCKDIVVFFKLRFHVFTELLHVLHEVRIDISLTTTYSIIVLNESSTGCLFHDIKDLFTITHTEDECSERTKVLSTTAIEQQVRINTLKFIHNSTDVTDTI